MHSEAVTAATRPPFPTYLLPSLSLPLPSTFRPFRRRQSSATSTSFTPSTPPLSASPTSSISSANTSPSSSPSYPGYFHQRHQSISTFAPAIQEGQTEVAEDEGILEPRLTRVQPDTLKCSTCSTDLAFASQIVSKGFTGRHGRAYLVSPPPISSSSTSPHKSPSSKQVEKGKDGDLINTKVGRSANRQLVTGAHVVADITCVVCSTVVGWKYVDAKETSQRYKIGKFILEMRRVVGEKIWEDMNSHPGGCRDFLEQELEQGASKAGGDEAVIFDSEDEDECDDLFAGIWDPEAVRQRRGRRVGNRRREG